MYYKKLILFTLVNMLILLGPIAEAQDTIEPIKGRIEIQCQYGLIDLPKGIIGVGFDYSKIIKAPALNADIKNIVSTFKDKDNKYLKTTDYLLNNFKVTDEKLVDLLIKYHVDSLKKAVPSAVKYDTIAVNKFGKTVPKPDFSQYYVLYFPASAPIKDILLNLKRIKKIHYVQPSIMWEINECPNEYQYDQGYLWHLNETWALFEIRADINPQGAWDRVVDYSSGALKYLPVWSCYA